MKNKNLRIEEIKSDFIDFDLYDIFCEFEKNNKDFTIIDNDNYVTILIIIDDFYTYSATYRKNNEEELNYINDFINYLKLQKGAK